METPPLAPKPSPYGDLVEEEIKLVEIFRQQFQNQSRRGSKIITADDFLNKLADEKAIAIIAAEKESEKLLAAKSEKSVVSVEATKPQVV
jgi:hypothetical protein